MIRSRIRVVKRHRGRLVAATAISVRFSARGSVLAGRLESPPPEQCSTIAVQIFDNVCAYAAQGFGDAHLQAIQPRLRAKTDAALAVFATFQLLGQADIRVSLDRRFSITPGRTHPKPPSSCLAIPLRSRSFAAWAAEESEREIIEVPFPAGVAIVEKTEKFGHVVKTVLDLAMSGFE
jgi:hypothetical protein